MSAPALPPSDPAPERSPVSEGDGTPWERRAAQRASLVADLTAAMERDPITPFKVNEDTLEVFADRLVRRGWRRVTEDPEPNAWRIEITVPLRLPVEQRHALFEDVRRAVEAWKPDDRDGWDSSVSGHPVYDDLLHDGSAVLRGGAQ